MGRTWLDPDGADPDALATPSPGDAFVPPAARYQLLDTLGAGGGGVVRRALDVHLGRVVALKAMAPPADRDAVERFEAEAQATAQLQHPGVVPVHDLDFDAQGRPFFTLAEVRGRTLEAVIAEVHRISGPNGWARTPDGWGLARLIDALARVADTVAFAHREGVLHRDLKPANIMVGPFGEVLVLDWGLAKIAPGGGVETGRSARGARTVMGTLSGTPAYMAPEQARGQRDRVGAQTDVYGLGAVLYQILTGRPPYVGDDPELVLLEVLAGPPVPPGYAGGDPELDELLDGPPPPGPPTPEPLRDLCVAALARTPEARPAGATAIAQALHAWLDGTRRRDRALEHLEAAAPLEQASREAHAEARALELRATSLRGGLAPWSDDEARAPVWALEDEARAALGRAAEARREADRLRQAAAQEAGDLPEIHLALAERAGQDLREAEGRADPVATARATLRLARHVEALPPSHPGRAALAALLRGDGALSLVTDPQGAEVLLERYETQHRRRVPVPAGSLGRTPLLDLPLPMGSYRLTLRLAGHHDARYPVLIGRQTRWTGGPHGHDGPWTVRLLPLGALPEGQVYVPAGPFLAGGDPEQDAEPARMAWCEGFVIDRFATTFADYLDFLNDLAEKGRLDEAARWEPRYTGTDLTAAGDPVLAQDVHGRYRLALKDEADLLPGEVNPAPDWPVPCVDHASAEAYAAWRAERDGLPWRLPTSLEWEKAARGVDGRIYPMGDHLDPSWTWMRDSLQGAFNLRPVADLPDDLSAYEVMGLAGNMRCWIARGEGAPISRGGAWGSAARASRCSFRVAELPGIRHSMCGVRLARSLGAGGGER